MEITQRQRREASPHRNVSVSLFIPAFILIAKALLHVIKIHTHIRGGQTKSSHVSVQPYYPVKSVMTIKIQAEFEMAHINSDMNPCS